MHFAFDACEGLYHSSENESPRFLKTMGSLGISTDFSLNKVVRDFLIVIRPSDVYVRCNLFIVIFVYSYRFTDFNKSNCFTNRAPQNQKSNIEEQVSSMPYRLGLLFLFR